MKNDMMTTKKALRILAGLLWAGTGAAVLAQPPSAALRTLYSFSGGNDGLAPYATVTIGSGGRLYGTTFNGGRYQDGVLFSLTPPASAGGPWTQRVLHSFDGIDGGDPTGAVVFGPGGVLYGTTVGKTNYGGKPIDGTVFSLTPPSAPGGSWSHSVLYSFGDGFGPLGSLAVGSGGVLYGTTQIGGTYNQGTVFSLTPPASPGGSWTETVLYSFGSDGKPGAGVAIGGGMLYGAAGNSVFSLTPPASPDGAWTESVLYTFTGGLDGGGPGGLAIGSGPSGHPVLYGMTYEGGAGTCGIYGFGCGTVFSLTPPASPGGSWTETVLHSFTDNPDGAIPYSGAGLSIGPNGVLYGTTELGGTSNDGTVFSLTPPASHGGAWTETVLHSFTGADGSGPLSSPAIGRGGVLYGTTSAGGTANSGTVFSLKP
jgi:uncharacterized repeat protein (TIGR03803 family)